MTEVTIKRSDRTLVFPPSERDEIRAALKGKMRWDRRTNRWLGLDDAEDLADLLQEAGYEVKIVGRA